MDEKIKKAELTDEQLEKVNGGYTQNDDGTYNIYIGDTFSDGHISVTASETKLNATLNTTVFCEWVTLDANGDLFDWGGCDHQVKTLLRIIGKYPL